MNKSPIAWSIAGSDSSAGAGIQANLKTMTGLGVYGCTVLTALTAQNTLGVSSIEPVSLAMLDAQLQALDSDLPPDSINLGLLHSRDQIELIGKYIQKAKVPIVCDPVMIATSGDKLVAESAIDALRQVIIPLSDVITPNLHEAIALADLASEIDLEELADDVATDKLIEYAAIKLLTLGPRSVLVKGGHRQGRYCQDFWTDGSQKIWLTSSRLNTTAAHGTGCTLSAAIAAALALGYSLSDALVVAKAYVNQGLRLAPDIGNGPGPLSHLSWPEFESDLPWSNDSALEGRDRPMFPRDVDVDFYPIVNRAAWLETILPSGVKTVQLRIKDLSGSELEDEVASAVALSRKYDAHLYVNDYWKLACKYKSFGVHLGQEDLAGAEIRNIQNAGLRLGISTHNYFEVSRALAYRPSYIAIGPIHHTTTKVMAHAPQGVAAQARWRRSLSYPLVAIGGIFRSNAGEILDAGAESIAVVRDVSEAAQPLQVCREWLELFASRTLRKREKILC